MPLLRSRTQAFFQTNIPTFRKKFYAYDCYLFAFFVKKKHVTVLPSSGFSSYLPLQSDPFSRFLHISTFFEHFRAFSRTRPWQCRRALFFFSPHDAFFRLESRFRSSSMQQSPVSLHGPRAAFPDKIQRPAFQLPVGFRQIGADSLQDQQLHACQEQQQERRQTPRLRQQQGQ